MTSDGRKQSPVSTEHQGPGTFLSLDDGQGGGQGEDSQH